jgi:hypothetical protein
MVVADVKGRTWKETRTQNRDVVVTSGLQLGASIPPTRVRENILRVSKIENTYYFLQNTEQSAPGLGLAP